MDSARTLSNKIAPFGLLHPGSVDRKNRALSLLSQSAPLFHSPKNQCTTWCRFTHSTQPGAPSVMFDADRPSVRDNLFGVLEIYTSKSAIATLASDTKFFKTFHDAVKAESPYDEPEGLVAWHPRAGFMARDGTAPPFGKGTIVVTAKVLAKDGMTEKFLVTYRPFIDWLKDNEPDTLSYTVFTRPKAPNEVLVFERYSSVSAFEAHRRSKVFRAMSKKVQPYIVKIILDEWEEQDGSFVGNIVGGGQESLPVKATANL